MASRYSQLSLKEALEEAKIGNLTAASNKFEVLLSDNSKTTQYTCFINLATVKFQQGFIEEAMTLLDKAIKLDPFNFAAYYNKFVINLSLSQNSEDRTHKIQAYLSLQCTLSCLYTQIASKLLNNYHQSNQASLTKNIKKSISLCENNVMAYLIRGRMYELNGKIKLSENDYDTAQDFYKEYALTYKMRADFLWRKAIKQKNLENKKLLSLKIERDLQQYKILINQTQSESFEFILHPQNKASFLDTKKINGLIEQSYQEFQESLMEFKEQKQVKEAQQLEKQEREIEEKEIQQRRKMKSVEKRASKKIDDLFAKSSMNNSGSDNIEDSKNISAQIQKLEKQIKNQRGRLDDSSNMDKSQQQSQSETFLTAEIERAAREIQQYKKQAQNQPNAKPHQSIETPAFQTQINKDILTINELKQFTKIKILIKNAQIFNQSIKLSGRQGTILIKYVNTEGQEMEIGTSSKPDFTWNQNLELIVANIRPNSEQSCMIEIKFELASKSIWGSSVFIGRGDLNLLQMRENQCLLKKNYEKTGIVHYSLKLQ